MAYIGTSPSNGVRRKHTYTATAGQTSFSGADDNNVTLTYVDTEYLDVYQNGVKLVAVSDYASTTGTSVVLTQGASVSDIIEIIVFDVFSVADTVSASDGGSFGGNVGVGGTLSVTGALSAKGGAVFNEDSADVDFRVESNGNANMLFVDGGNNHVNIGSSSDAGGVLNVSDGTSFSTGITVENTGDTHGSVIDFLNNSDSPADDDYIGGLIFKETNSAGGTHQFAKIFGIATDITDGTEDGALTFETSAGGASTAEHMRITEGGDVLFQKTSAVTSGAGTFFNVPTAPSTMPVYLRFCKTYSGLREGISFAHSDSQVGGITFDNSSTAFNTSSDYRLKENVVTDWDATTRLKQLKPSRFNFIADADKTVDGFLAHEVSSIVPEAISGTKDAVEVWEDGEKLPDDVSVGDNKLDDDGNTIPKYQSIDQSKIVPLLVKTIQELEARITALENGE
jgi:prepilin-type processing-associated H-X9-DG protein